MKTRVIIILIGVAICCMAICQQFWHPTVEWFRRPRISQRPVGGFVRSEKTAILIGRAIITDAFGVEFAKDIEPLKAKEIEGVWIVYSHFMEKDRDGKPRLGGVTTVQISRTSGAILCLESER